MKQLFKFAGSVLDCYDDPVFISSPKAQAYFGDSLVSPEDVDDLSDQSFAVKIASRTGYKRRFPIYNETVTKISCHYFEAGYDALPEEIRKVAGYNLGQACEKYGITKKASVAQYEENVGRTVEYVSAVTKEPSLSSDEIVKSAEFRLACELPKMPVVNRTRAATAFYKTAGEDAITRQDVWDYVEKPVVGPNLEAALDDREYIAKAASPELRCIFENLRDQIEEMEPTDAVNTLVAFDKYASFDDRYADGLVDPYAAVYGGWTIPTVRKRNELWHQEKQAQLVDGSTGQAVPAETAQGLSVEQHLFNLQKQFPKGSESFQKAAAAGLSENMQQKWGTNYVRARKIYFGE